MKQLHCAKMSKKRATILNDDVFEIARVLTYLTATSGVDEDLMVVEKDDQLTRGKMVILP